LKFLHVGCGHKRIDSTTIGFNTGNWEEIRYDIDDEVCPDVVGSMIDMSIISSGSMDAVYSSHNLEHLYPHEVEIALKEFSRVLNDGGFVVLTCPDLQSICQFVVDDKLSDVAYNSKAGPIAPLDMLFGFRPSLKAGNHFMAHKTGFTKKTLIQAFRSVGFTSTAAIRREQFFDLFIIGFKKNVGKEILVTHAKEHFPRGSFSTRA